MQKTIDGLRGTAAGLVPIFEDLGWNAEDAARAIDARLNQAIAKIARGLEQNVSDRIAELSGKGYTTSVRDFLTDFEQMKKDFAAAGADSSRLPELLRLELQAIVDGAELTGDAFAELVRMTNTMSGHLGEARHLLERIRTNLAHQNVKDGLPFFQVGGYTGNLPTTAAAGIVHGQEFVAHAEATRRWRPMLEQMNAGTFRMPAVAMPAPMSFSNDNRELVAESRARSRGSRWRSSPSRRRRRRRSASRELHHVEAGADEGGRRFFAAFGLGKSIIQIEICRILLILATANSGRALIVAPLGVRREFVKDAAMLGVPVRFVRSSAEIDAPGLYLTNYESVRDGKIDVALFDIVSLDEASCLRGFGGTKTFREFMRLFDADSGAGRVAYRFVATATPSPNETIEILAYAAFLGVMDVGQAKTRFFKRNSEKADTLTLHAHKVEEFWFWVASWGLFIQRPSDLGFSDEGYELPELRVVYHEVKADLRGRAVERDGQGILLRNAAIGVQDAAREKRETLGARIQALRDILAIDPTDHAVLWHDLEDERRAIEAAVPTAISVYGTQDLDAREQAIADFSDGRTQYLAAKPVMLGSGCNLQRHCATAVFLGIGFKFNDFIQAIHRLQRFLQTQHFGHGAVVEFLRREFENVQAVPMARLSTLETERARADAAEQRAADALARAEKAEEALAEAQGALVDLADWLENDCGAELPHSHIEKQVAIARGAPPRAERAERGLNVDATMALIEGALKWANWCAGEGICAVEGEGVIDPDTLLLAYSQSTDDEDWETLHERLPALLRASREAQPATDGGEA